MPDATSCSEYCRDSVQVINLSSLTTWRAGRSRSWLISCLVDIAATHSRMGSTVLLKNLNCVFMYILPTKLSTHQLVLTERSFLAHTGACLSSGPIGMMSFKRSGLGGWGETDMCCYLALLHIYREAATANDGIREEGRVWSRWTAFPPRASDDTAEGRRTGEKLDRCWERDMCFFSSAAWEIAGNGEKRREKESKKGQVKYFPLWQRKWGKVERASSVLRNGLSHPQRGFWNSQLHKAFSKCTH